MDQNLHNGEQIAMADKSFLECSTPVKKLDIRGSKHLDANFVSPTPEKTAETLNVRSKKEPVKLSEKYRILSEFFDRMTTSLRLLNLRKGLPTFQNICRQVEALTGRKFSYRHLAQIKFILPEAVQTDKILLHNKKTLCMEPDIKVTLLFDVIQGHIEHSAYMALCRTFSSRLLKFVSTHSEDCDIPEADLPEPFNQKETTISVNSLSVESSTLPNIDESEPLNPSHLNPSFSRRFSRKDAIEEPTKTQLSISPSSNKETGFSSCLDPVKHGKALQVSNEDTPIKLPLVADGLIIGTPDLSTPKRSVPNEENKIKNVMANNMFVKRSLAFSVDEESAFLEEKTTGKAEDTSCCASKNDGVIQSGLKADQHTSNCLSDIVDTIHNIFQSAHSSSITKSELVYKIMVNNFDVTESGEVEEQIELLETKVPEWFSKKVAPSGDLLYSINKGLDLNSISEKLL